MSKVLVTGSNRGIGLELCRQYHERGDNVIAACRKSNAELDAIGVQVVSDVDVGSDESVARLAAGLQGVSLDILINNAGILRGDTIDNVDFADMQEQYNINTIGPLRVVRALRSNLSDGAKVGIVTSRVGSIDDKHHRTIDDHLSRMRISVHRHYADQCVPMVLRLQWMWRRS